MDTRELREKYHDIEIGFCRVIHDLCDEVDRLKQQLENREKEKPKLKSVRKIA